MSGKPIAWYPGYEPRHGLVGLFPMWEGGGGGISDIVGGRHGTFNSTNIAWSFDEFGSSVNLALAASDDITHDNMPFDTEYTIVALVRAASTSGNDMIATDVVGTPIKYQFDRNNADLRLNVRDNSGNLSGGIFSSVIVADEWFVAAGRRNGGLVNVFHNGIAGTEDTDTIGAIDLGQAVIGNRDGTTSGWDGDISVVAFFDYAIPDEAIPATPEDVFDLIRQPDITAILSAGVAAPAGITAAEIAATGVIAYSPESTHQRRRQVIPV